MPRLLYRFLLSDLLRIGGLTTAVLVLVIAFGATLKPLSRESLLSAGQVAKYLLLATVPMLQFALPFAAGFAGTLTFHRMTTDNEVVAAAAGGISYRRLLFPIVVLGLVLTLMMVGLTQYVVPRFWSYLERTVTQDLTTIFQASIERGEPFQLDELQIWADDLVAQANPPDTGADVRLILHHVAAANLDEQGRITTDVTASQAVIDIYRRPEATTLKLAMSDTIAYRADEGMLAYMERPESSTLVIPNVSSTDTRAMTRGELLDVYRNPDTYGSVIRVRLDVAEALRDAEFWRMLDERLQREGRVELSGHGQRGQRFVVEADGVRRGRFTTREGGPVVVRRLAAEGADRLFMTRDARVVRHVSGALPSATYDLQLMEVSVQDLQAEGEPNVRRQVVLENLTGAMLDAFDPMELSSPEMMARAQELGDGGGSNLISSAERLQEKVISTRHEIISRLAARYALSTTAVLLLTLGATLAMLLRESLPLMVYLWSFLPSVCAIVLISGGGQIIRDGAIAGGMAVTWGGNLALLVLLIVSYRRLARN